jgi:hypothetical protein
MKYSNLLVVFPFVDSFVCFISKEDAMKIAAFICFKNDPPLNKVAGKTSNQNEILLQR